MGDPEVEITFDEDNRIRVMPKEKYKATETLEQEKLRAIGQRNKAEMEADTRRRKEAQMKALIAEKECELERYISQLSSLEKVEQEQMVLIEKLSNNETA